jgi:hypothetical protein
VWLSRVPIGACKVTLAFDYLRLFAAKKFVERSVAHALGE